VPTGLLTLPAKKLTTATDRVDTTVVGDVPAGSTATVDVRARTSSGGWSEWIPAGVGSIVSLPEPSSEVQARLVLTGPPKADPTAAAGSGATGPAVRGVSLTTHPATAAARADAAASSKSPVHSRVFATREGLVGATTANGHKIKKKDHFVALPSRRALSPRGTNDYTVKVCASNGRCAFAPVWDVGPWNTRDDYWNPSSKRQEWKDLPQGMPEAQAAKQKGYNGGRDQFKRKVANPAGIDLGDGIFWDALKLKDNSWVTVDYLWTGSTKMAKVTSEGKVRGAPDSDAEVVGIATLKSSVPVECVQGKGKNRWLRIGIDQYLSAKAVDDLGSVGPCSAIGKTTSADHSDDRNKKGAATEGAVADGRPAAGQGATPATGKPSDLAPRAVVDGAPDGTPPAGGTAATGATATEPAEPGTMAVRPGGTGSVADRPSAAAASG
jgi:hypothetical protein